MGGLYDILEAYRQQNEPRFIYEGLYQDPDRFLDYDNSRRDFSGQADYPFTGNIPTNARARYDARAFNRGEPLPLPYGLKGGTFFKDFNPRVGIINPLDPNKYANPVGPMNVNTGIMTQAPDFERFQGITKETDIDDDTQDIVNNIVRRVEDDDLEASAIPEFAEGELKQPFGLQSLLSFLPFGDNSILGKIGQGIRNTIQGSRFYRPATTGIFGYSPAELNRMNALGGFYSEPAREGRRRANRISRMLQRAAAGKKFSQKNLSNLMNQFNMGDVDTRGMIDSIRQSADMGYGKGGGRDFDSGRDYSSSPGAIAGDMEYGEE